MAPQGPGGGDGRLPAAAGQPLGAPPPEPRRVGGGAPASCLLLEPLSAAQSQHPGCRRPSGSTPITPAVASSCRAEVLRIARPPAPPPSFHPTWVFLPHLQLTSKSPGQALLSEQTAGWAGFQQETQTPTLGSRGPWTKAGAGPVTSTPQQASPRQQRGGHPS